MKIHKGRNNAAEPAFDDGYKKLACAAVEQAVEDYKTTCMIEMPYSRGLAQKPLEMFFRSQWCYDLCGVSKGIWEDFFVRNNSIDLADEKNEITYAGHLKELMKKHGIKQADITRGTGVIQSSISDYVNGIAEPREKNRMLIKKYFDSL